MRPIFTKLLILLSMAAYSQQSNTKPVIIQGKFENFTDTVLFLFYQNDLYISDRDMIKVNADGSFYHETYKIKQPIIATRISDNNNYISLDNIALAPGYHITIKANARDATTFKNTIQFSGEGAAVNTAWTIAEKMSQSALNAIKWKSISVHELKVKMIETQQYISTTFDSLLTPFKLPEQEKFVRMYDYQRFYINCAFLMQELTGMSYSPGEIIAQIDSFGEMKKINPLLQNDLLIVPTFREFLYRYVDKQNSIINQQRQLAFTSLNYAISIPELAVRDYSLYKSFDDYIEGSRSFEGLILLHEKFAKMYHFFSEKGYANAIAKKFEDKFAQLQKLSIGNTIPDIILQDSVGTNYKFSDFRGKVLFLDLWASWCAPCRAENPGLKKIVASYEGRADIKFISISIDRDSTAWKKAVRVDNLQWLQLIDDNKETFKTRLYVKSIPRFIVVSKAGNIVTFDGPWPSETESVKSLLDAELAK